MFMHVSQIHAYASYCLTRFHCKFANFLIVLVYSFFVPYVWFSWMYDFVIVKLQLINILLLSPFPKHQKIQSLSCQGGKFLVPCVNPFTLRVSLKSVVCYSHIFENISWIKQKNHKIFEGEFLFCLWSTFLLQMCSRKCVCKLKYFQNCQASFGCSECWWVK